MHPDSPHANMIKQQIRTVDVTDERVLEVLQNTSRAHFVPKHLEKLAYADVQIDIGHHQVMMLPSDEARMLQALNIQSNDKILEIGTGTGYVTALLAKLSREVVSVDIIQDFIVAADEKLRQLKIKNVKLNVGDASFGWPNEEPYDVIAITGSMEWLPLAFRESLQVGGRLFAIIGQEPIMEAQLITRTSEQEYSVDRLFETRLKPLINAAKKERFIF